MIKIPDKIKQSYNDILKQKGISISEFPFYLKWL
jgi:hypothetical protein